MSKLFVMRGKEVIEVHELKAGDIGAIAKRQIHRLEIPFR